MPTAESYEHLLDCAHVLAVDVDGDTVVAYVSQKCDEHQLDEADVIANNVADDTPTDVYDLGLDDADEDLRPLVLDPDNPPISIENNRQIKHRPVEAGVSEAHSSSTAATAGPYPARVTDTDAAEWADHVTEGDLVRVSNCHVYARSGDASFGDSIRQPSPFDGGTAEDDSGTLAGYVPIEDGTRVDAAARTASVETDEPLAHNLTDSWPTGIHRSDPADLADETLVKTGRTTGIDRGRLLTTGASVRVNYGDHGQITLRDQLLTEAISEGGDSGSPVFADGSGELVGLLFAGSSQVSVVNPIANVEADLGVEFLAGGPPTPLADVSERVGVDYAALADAFDGPLPEQDFEDIVEAWLRQQYGDTNVSRQHYYEDTGRIADFVVDSPVVRFAIEVENEWESVIGGVGAAILYAEHPDGDRGAVPLVIVPEGCVERPEVEFLREQVRIIEFPLPEESEE